jgi:predicted lipid-binding transport protein (Tim44 family)
MTASGGHRRPRAAAARSTTRRPAQIEITEAEPTSDARLAVKFNAEVVSATRETDGTLVEGHGEEVQQIADEWTFARSPKSRDPNWKLVATNQLS